MDTCTLMATPAARGVAEGRVVRWRPGDLTGFVVLAETTRDWGRTCGAPAAFLGCVGGPLSAGATVARERRIPGVVGLDAAMADALVGARVRVDGAGGTVEVLAD